MDGAGEMGGMQALAALNELALGIWAAEDIDELGSVLLSGLHGLVRHEVSMLYCRPVGKVGDERLISLTIPSEELERYRAEYLETDYTVWYLKQPGVKVFRDSDIIDQQFMESSQLHREWIVPLGVYWSCVTVVRSGGVFYADLTLMRSREEGDFSDEELTSLSLVTDQLEQWLRMHHERPSQLIDAELHGNVDLLSAREREVAALAASGYATKQIARLLGITYGTVRKHLANIYRKLGVSSRIEMARALRM